MGWKNNKTLGIWLGLGAILSGGSYAQSSGELLWWVTNEASFQSGLSPTVLITPPYAQQANPYPYNPIPVTVAPAPIAPEILENSREQELLAEGNRILRQIQSLMIGGQAIRADTAQIRVNGYLKGPDGPRALINGLWKREGETLNVSSHQQESFSNMLARLAQITPALMQELEGDLAKLTQENATLVLTITQIEPQQLTLQDTRNRIYTVTYP